jgi:DDE superfamily endonuclease
MPLSHLPPALTSAFLALAAWLDRRSAARLPRLLLGILLATGRRTVTSWFKAAAITDEFRPAYVTVCAVGRAHQDMAVTTLHAVKPLLSGSRLRLAIDDTPTPRYGPFVEGCGRDRSAAGAGRRLTARGASAWPSVLVRNAAGSRWSVCRMAKR